MTISIQLMVNAGSGVLAAVVTQLQASGIKVKSHKLERVNDKSSLLTMNAESTSVLDKAELKSNLSSIPVVQSIEELDLSTIAPARTEPEIEVPADVVDRVVAAFPRIMPLIQNYEEQVAKDPQRTAKLNKLGLATGKQFSADWNIDTLETKADVIDKMIIPKIGQIAEASRQDDTVVVRISLFTRRHVTSMDLIGGENENCYFLCGLIEGMASSVPSFASVSVDEQKCRANGDDNCVFVLN